MPGLEITGAAPPGRGALAAGGYDAPVAASATKTNTPLADVPQSVQVITRQILDDQAAQTLVDATRNVAGVTGAFGFFGLNNGCVRVRGFSTEQGSVGCTYYRNGVRVWAQPIPFASLESVEVVKGPNTVLFGRNEPGGIVNVTTKMPVYEPLFSVKQTIGSFGTSITSVDLGDALNESRTLAYRLNAAYSTTDNFREGAFDKLANVNAALEWKPVSGTKINFSADYAQQVYRPDFGLPALGNRPAPVPVTRSYKQDYIDSRTDAAIMDVSIQQRLAEGWEATAKFTYAYMEPTYFNVYGFGLNETTLQYPVTYFGEQFSYRRTYQANLDIVGDVRLLGTDHKLLFGFDYNDERYDGPIFFSDGPTAGAPDLDLFNPARGSAPQIYPGRDQYTPFGSVQQWYGFFAQDQVKLSEQFLFNVGFRFDRATAAFSPNPIADAVTESAVKPRVGAVYKPIPDLSLYAQYQEAFGPNNGRSATNEQFRGQTADQIEVGAKWTTPDRRFLATVAFFELNKQNLLTADLTTADPFDRVAVGAVRNRGIEIDLSGRVTDGLSLIGSYAFSDAKTTRDNSGNEGRRYEGVPRHAGSLWMRYDIDRRWSVGSGVFVEGSRPGDLANTFFLPAYARVDAMAQYRFTVGTTNLVAQVNINNVFDETYYVGVYNNTRDFILPGAPLGVLASLKADF